jgi:hypothetical protein
MTMRTASNAPARDFRGRAAARAYFYSYYFTPGAGTD